MLCCDLEGRQETAGAQQMQHPALVTTVGRRILGDDAAQLTVDLVAAVFNTH